MDHFWPKLKAQIGFRMLKVSPLGGGSPPETQKPNPTIVWLFGDFFFTLTSRRRFGSKAETLRLPQKLPNTWEELFFHLSLFIGCP